MWGRQRQGRRSKLSHHRQHERAKGRMRGETILTRNHRTREKVLEVGITFHKAKATVRNTQVRGTRK